MLFSSEDNVLKTDNLRSKTLEGLLWNLLSRGGMQVTSLVIGVLLARLLSPREFGFLGMITIFIGLANLFLDLGLGSAIIQKQDVTHRQLSSIFWLNIGLGLGLTASLILISPSVALFYSEPVLIPIMMVLSFRLAIGSSVLIHRSLLKKAIDFRQIMVIELSGVLVSGVIGVALALWGYGVWSLVVRSLVDVVLVTFFYWVAFKWRPQFVFDWNGIRELVRYGLNQLGIHLLNYATRSTDNLLIGRFLGSASLGLYTRAYQFMLYPLQNVVWAITGVLFSSLSQIQDDRQRVKRVYLRALSTVVLIVSPLMIGALVTADLFVPLVLGLQWVEIVPLVQIFCVAGLFDAIIALGGALFLSQGEVRQQFRVMLGLRLFNLAGVIIGFQWGIIGVAWGILITTVIAFYPYSIVMGRLIDLSFSELLRGIVWPIACSLLMGLVVYVLPTLFGSDWSDWFHLLFAILTGSLVYALLVHLSGIVSFHMLYKEAVAFLRQRQAASI
jgi:O-antigen/teichoic acid export membrane protein